MGLDRLRRVAGVLGALCRTELTRTVHRGTGDAAPHERAREVRRALEELGPFYIKLGQMLSTRPDIVSRTMIAELENLHDHVHPLPFSDFESVLAADLGSEWKEQFRDFDILEPVGTASLAQVYRVTLRDGSPGVVKIQRPDVAATVLEDMALLRKAARIVGKGAPRFNAVVDIDAMLGVLFDAMRPELDFTAEAANMREARKAVRDFPTLDVPTVVQATRHVLVQTLAPGRSVREIAPEELPAALRKAIGTDLLALQFRGFFVNRMFHADPHPGNIFVDGEGRATLIDWGMVGRVDRRTSMTIMLVLLHLARNDGHGLAKAWTELGHATAWADVPAFAADMAALTPQIAAASLSELNFGVTLTSVLQQSTKRGIKTNPVISVLGKSFANMEGSVRFLAPELSITDVFQQQLARMLAELAKDALSAGNAARTLVELMLVADTLTEQARSVTGDLSDREFTFHVNQNAPARTPRSTRLRDGLAGAALAALWARRNR
ncbi:AarF/ABC1/UbiB kinase family protein [Saccharopolyspora sp. HNM0986]|uniref:ABC1 kinase family protein n=1 Tax=Saccharopolyspora galaxeae TaxID=2781241 RepID=UPI00190B5A22|nr:AarF/UbiB family protein [Saccharopolyspora sp. HNM0986]MBK0869473.1 AarF/ABC1/UbiB kinase family protein [Saccharopolyspora sp. HNM0986]